MDEAISEIITHIEIIKNINTKSNGEHLSNPTIESIFALPLNKVIVIRQIKIVKIIASLFHYK